MTRVKILANSSKKELENDINNLISKLEYITLGEEKELVIKDIKLSTHDSMYQVLVIYEINDKSIKL